MSLRNKSSATPSAAVPSSEVKKPILATVKVFGDVIESVPVAVAASAVVLGLPVAVALGVTFPFLLPDVDLKITL